MVDWAICLTLGLYLFLTGLLGVTSVTILWAREISLFCALIAGVLFLFKVCMSIPSKPVP